MLPLSEKWAAYFNSIPETGMGYVIVSVVLKDGRRYDCVCVDSGVITKVGESSSIPFTESDIAQFQTRPLGV
jgi:hypothetical protein